MSEDRLLNKKYLDIQNIFNNLNSAQYIPSFLSLGKEAEIRLLYGMTNDLPVSGEMIDLQSPKSSF